jgi:mono/diheme cytochrome c family protein
MLWRRTCVVVSLTVLAACLPVRAARPAGGEQAEPAEAADAGAILNGYRRYHATCSHCHGPDGVGSSFGPGLVERPLPWAAFEAAVLEGTASGSFVMRGFADDPNVAPYVRDIYSYLRARAAGAIGRGRPHPGP